MMYLQLMFVQVFFVTKCSLDIYKFARLQHLGPAPWSQICRTLNLPMGRTCRDKNICIQTLFPEVNQALVSFLRNTSMPGLKFLVKRDFNLSIVEWLFWLVSCISALVLSGHLIQKVSLQKGIQLTLKYDLHLGIRSCTLGTQVQWPSHLTPLRPQSGTFHFQQLQFVTWMQSTKKRKVNLLQYFKF